MLPDVLHFKRVSSPECWRIEPRRHLIKYFMLKAFTVKVCLMRTSLYDLVGGGKSVYICSDQPRSEAGWNAGLHREEEILERDNNFNERITAYNFQTISPLDIQVVALVEWTKGAWERRSNAAYCLTFTQSDNLNVNPPEMIGWSGVVCHRHCLV